MKTQKPQRSGERQILLGDRREVIAAGKAELLHMGTSDSLWRRHRLWVHGICNQESYNINNVNTLS